MASEQQGTLWGINGLEPNHDSLQMPRTTSDAEWVYQRQWAKENRRTHGVNSGFTTLEWILCPSSRRWPECVSQRDAHVAASVIQWLGTNCGYCFLRNVEGMVDRLRATRREWDHALLNEELALTKEEKEVAAMIARKYVTGHAVRGLTREIEAAMAGRLSRVREEMGATTRPIQFEETNGGESA